MRKKGTEKILNVDLAEVEWEISFPCPRCGEAIFPEDNTGRSHSLLRITIDESVVKEAVIQCSGCGGMIHLEIGRSTIGFPSSFVLTRNEVGSTLSESCCSMSHS